MRIIRDILCGLAFLVAILMGIAVFGATSAIQETAAATMAGALLLFVIALRVDELVSLARQAHDVRKRQDKQLEAFQRQQQKAHLSRSNDEL